jgi:hypothetical protein
METVFQYICSANEALLNYHAGTKLKWIINLNDLSSFKVWLKRLATAIENSQLQDEWHDVALEYFKYKLNAPPHIYKLEGAASTLAFKWQNNEPLIIPLWNNKIIRETDYWLSYYPFLQRCNGNMSAWSIRDGWQIIRSTCDNEASCIVSHNGHFGHFIYDNLPFLQLLAISMNNYLGPIKGIPETLSNDIKLLANFALNSRLAKVSHSHIDCNYGTGSKIIEICNHNNFCDIFSNNIFVNAYLLKSLHAKLLNIYKDCDNCVPGSSSPSLLFFYRNGDYKSRIYNFTEIKKSLGDLGFYLCDPSQLNPIDLCKLTQDADIIVAETGTTSLVANIFSPDKTKVISLVPERLASQPTRSMLESGIPYIIAFYPKASIFKGHSIQHLSIQTSDTVIYSAEKLARTIDNIMSSQEV